jgi:hypothetical protein
VNLRDRILAATPRLVPVDCPAWGCTVQADGSLTLADRLELARLAKEDGDITIPLVILGARDEHGARLFTAADAEALAGKDGGTLQAIALAVVQANGMTAEATEAARKN